MNPETKNDKALSEEAKEARREYYRNYRKTHKEQIEESRRAYWERQAEKQKEQA